MESCSVASKTLIRSQSIEDLNRNLQYISVNGVSGVLQSHSVRITRGWDRNDNAVNQSNNNNDTRQLQHSGYDGGDCVVIKVPYAGSFLTFNLLFYTSEPWIPPEFNLSDDHFSSNITLKDLEEQVPSLNEWNMKSNDMVAQLVHQVLQLYRRYQVDRLEKYDALQIHYQSLLKTLKIGDEDIEIIISGTTTSSSLLRLPLILHDVPPVFIDSNPGPRFILLQLDFPREEGGKRAKFLPKLYMSPHIKSLLDEECGAALPIGSPKIGLLDYVNTLMTLLEDKVRTTIHSFRTRKLLIVEMLSLFGRSVIEYDIERFKKIVLMLEVKDFHFLVILTLRSNFPQVTGPKVILQSLYHFDGTEPVSEEVTDLPFNSQWKEDKMVQEIKAAILKSVPSFQLNSTRKNIM